MSRLHFDILILFAAGVPEYLRRASARTDVKEFFHHKLHDREGRSTFVGREWLDQQLQQEINKGSKCIFVVGPPGVGKSTFMSFLVRRAQTGASPVPVLASHACMADDLMSLSAATFVRSIASAICEQLSEFALAAAEDPEVKAALSESVCEGDPVSSFVNGVLRPLARCKLSRVHCIVVDSLDESLVAPQKVVQSLICLSLFIRLPSRSC